MKTLLKCATLSNSIRKMSSQPYREVKIPVPWGHIAGKWWGPTDVRPILAIHGWQDNSGSFDTIIPLLDNNRSFLAIDLPGHGLSSWLPTGSNYHYSDYIVLVLYLKEYFKWPRISLMGHSLGAAVGFGYTMFNPNKVDFLVGFDAIKPVRRSDYSSMHKGLENMYKFCKHVNRADEPPSYAIEEMRKKMCEPHNNSITEDVCDHVLKRNIKPSQIHPGKFYFSRDPRLKVLDLLSIPQEDMVKWAPKVTTPMAVFKAKNASYYEPKELFYEVVEELKKASKDFQLHYVEGKHHVHLTNPERVAENVNKFILKHSDEDHSVQKIRKEILIN